MNETTTKADALPLPTDKDVLTEVLRQGATQLLAQAIQAEVAAYLDSHTHLHDEAGQRQVVRNGSRPQRTILTGIGPVEVKQPPVCRTADRPTSGRSSAVRSCRRTCGKPKASRS